MQNTQEICTYLQQLGLRALGYCETQKTRRTEAASPSLRVAKSCQTPSSPKFLSPNSAFWDLVWVRFSSSLYVVSPGWGFKLQHVACRASQTAFLPVMLPSLRRIAASPLFSISISITALFPFLPCSLPYLLTQSPPACIRLMPVYTDHKLFLRAGQPIRV